MKRNNYSLKLILSFVAICLFTVNTNAQSKKQVQEITQKYNLQRLQKIEQKFKQKTTTEKSEALKIAKQRGWKTKFTTKDGRFVELQRVVDGKPIYYTTFNANAAKSTRANHLNSGGSLGLNLMGQGLTAHVWDGGVARTSHQEYDGAGGNNRYKIGDGTNSKNYHAAHVTGTIMAAGVKPEAKGMAPYAKAVGYDWSNDKTEATSAASNGMLLSNHSYGYAFRNAQGQVQLPQYYFGGYIGESRDWDQIMFNAPNYLMVVAAGNDGNDNTANNNPTGGSGFDKLTGHSTAKNNLVVANAQDANIGSNGNLISVTINASSSEGPTDDYRIKPDITGNGTNVYSSVSSSDNAYRSLTGTSMASPNVTGTLLLLQQHYRNLNNNFMKAATLKGLALHTADDAGASGPDAVFGWGLLNAKKAAETISKRGSQSKIEELTLNSGQSYTITVESDGTSPLLASISWTDRPGTATTSVNSTTPVLVNDLDIRVKKGGTNYLPYELTGATTSAKRDNNVDPFERVDVGNASGTYTITVTHKGSLTGGSQKFSLIVTGIAGEPGQTGYCASKGNNASDEYIQKVELGSINNASGSGNGYTDHTSISTNLAKNSSNTITITPKWSGTSYNEGYGVFIDYNQDGDFADSGETVWTKAASKDTPVSGSFTIPSSAKDGETRMRVVMQYNKIPSSCGAYDYGETEDYTVVIGSTGGGGSDTQAPSAPSNLTASNVQETSVTLSWGASSDNIGVTDYDVYQGSNKLGSTPSTGATITGLTASTTYSFSVKARDAAGNESTSSNTVTVTTPGGQVTYCDSKGNNSSYEWIDYVAFGGMTNSTGNDGGYKDYTSKVATVQRGTTNKITLSAGFQNTAYNEYWAVYIDFNGDGDFDDAGEKADEGNSDSANNLTGDIAIPSTAKLGATRMRISMKYNAAQTPCEAFSYGEVEDYTVNITNNSVASFANENLSLKGEDLRNRTVSGFGVYPNPSSGFISLRLDRNAKGSYRIINPLGRTVKQGISGNTIDISSLETGMYVIEFNDGQKVLTTKLFKK